MYNLLSFEIPFFFSFTKLKEHLHFVWVWPLLKHQRSLKYLLKFDDSLRHYVVITPNKTITPVKETAKTATKSDVAFYTQINHFTSSNLTTKQRSKENSKSHYSYIIPPF